MNARVTTWLTWALVLLSQALVLADGAFLIQRRAFEVAPTKSFEIARFEALIPAQTPVAVLVVCPGENQDGRLWLRERLWRSLPQEQGWAVVGCQFVSKAGLLRQEQGYFAAESGSGQALIDALKMFVLQDTPLLLYGFSGGAHFVAAFAKHYAGRVSAWAAYSAVHWTQPDARMRAPAVIGCGQEDAVRYGASLAFFQQGRRLNHPWLWVSTVRHGHRRATAFEEFIVCAFESMLNDPGRLVVVDRTTKEPVPRGREGDPTSHCILPASGYIMEHWQKIHTP